MRGRRALALAAGVALLLVLPACSGDEEAPPEGAAADEPPPQPEPPSVCPLTGREPPDGVRLSRPAVALKIENSREARPQAGLENADLVFEEIVEGGITRFMAIYHCGDADRAGPVRSARFDDPKIARPFTRVLAFSGANRIVERELDKKKMVSLTELNTPDPFFRVPPGTLDIHSLFVDVAKLRRAASATKGKLVPPRAGAFDFGARAPNAKRARRVTINFNASNSIEYRWRGGEWKRWEAGEPFMSAAGKQLGTANLLVQQVEVNNSATIVDPAGNPSPDIALRGRGKAWLFRDGHVTKGMWRIRKEGTPAIFSAKGGRRFVFDVGSIWVELVPSRAGDVKGSVAFK